MRLGFGENLEEGRGREGDSGASGREQFVFYNRSRRVLSLHPGSAFLGVEGPGFGVWPSDGYPIAITLV